MRQSTLAFGQRPLNVPPTVQSAEEVKPETKDTFHPFFTKRIRKEEQKSQEDDGKPVNSSLSASDDQPPMKKRTLKGLGKNTTAKSKQPLTPWPGKGESLIEPEIQISSYGDRIDQLTAFEKRADAIREGTNTPDDEHIWSWLHLTKESDYQNQGEWEKQNGHHTTTDDFIESHINLQSCRDSIGKLPKAIEGAKIAAKLRQNDQSSQLWTDKWRPRYAAQSLGNEKQAIYMRDWLEVLKVADPPSNGAITGPPLTSNKPQSRQIIKKAQKKRGRPSAMKEMDDFIVGDTAEEEAWFDQFRKTDVSSDLSQDQSASVSALADQSDLDFGKSNRLTNVMVIEGPSGCGKTASVYACANELGYEVFEIFPGMGKRSGVNLSAMVGDLCRNHMVSSGGTGGGAFQGKFVHTMQNGINDNVQLSSSSNGAPHTLRARQSLILVEEADTMYEDDKGFWLGLIELASESLRPIILTCNDLTAIPVQSLPIQKILQYSKSSAAHLVPYLQLIALSEGYQVDSKQAAQFCHDTVRIEEQLRYAELLLLPMHGPVKSTLIDNLAEGKGDLRQTIMQLQFDCKGKQSPSTPKSRNQIQPKTLRQLIRSADLESFADSVFARPFDRSAAELEFEQFGPSPDEVQAMGKGIYLSPSKGVETCLPIYGRESDYISFFSANQNTLPVHYHHRRAALSKDIEDVSESQNISVQSRLFSLEAVLDYAPVIHKMVIIDDQEEDLIKTSVETMLQEGANEEIALIAKGYNRQKINFIRKQDKAGLLDLLLRETNFVRWLILNEQQSEQARRIAPSTNW